MWRSATSGVPMGNADHLKTEEGRGEGGERGGREGEGGREGKRDGEREKEG